MKENNNSIKTCTNLASKCKYKRFTYLSNAEFLQILNLATEVGVGNISQLLRRLVSLPNDKYKRIIEVLK